MTSLNITKVGGNIVEQKVHLIDGFFTCGLDVKSKELVFVTHKGAFPFTVNISRHVVGLNMTKLWTYKMLQEIFHFFKFLCNFKILKI
jgi:hypothetical protein